MAISKTIITKAIYGQNIEKYLNTLHIGTYEGKEPSNVLGCTATGASITDTIFIGDDKDKKMVQISGKYDIHVWYESNDDTRVFKDEVDFSEKVNIISDDNTSYSNEEVKGWIEEAPVCLSTRIEKNSEGTYIVVEVEYALGAEIIGETKLNVMLASNEHGEV